MHSLSLHTLLITLIFFPFILCIFLFKSVVKKYYIFGEKYDCKKCAPSIYESSHLMSSIVKGLNGYQLCWSGFLNLLCCHFLGIFTS